MSLIVSSSSGCEDQKKQQWWKSSESIWHKSYQNWSDSLASYIDQYQSLKMRKKAIHVNWVRGFFPFGFSCTDTLWYFSTAHSDSSVLAAPLACHPSHVDAVSCIVRTVRNDKVAKWTHHKTKETKVKGSRKTTMTMSPQVMAIVMSPLFWDH